MARHRETPYARMNPSGRKVWVARYTGPDGKRRSAGTFEKKREAQDAIDRAYEQPIVTRDTVGAYAKDWTARYPRSPRTNKTNDGRIAQVLDVRVDGKPLRSWRFSELRRRHALELIDVMLREQSRATTGAANILRALSAMAEDAITDEIIGANPFKGVRVRTTDPRATKQPRKPRVLSWDEMHALARAGGRYEAMLRMLADCGLRVGELFALRRDLQDLKAGVFRVEGSAYAGRLVGSSHQKQHDRVGPIPPGCLDLLRGMPARIDSPWLFPTPGGQLWRYENWRRDVWNPARDASGIVASPQDFRHSWNSLLLGAGINRRDLADIAGHSEEVNARTYTHGLGVSFDAIRRAVG